jgi:hypothetical protein
MRDVIEPRVTRIAKTGIRKMHVKAEEIVRRRIDAKWELDWNKFLGSVVGKLHIAVGGEAFGLVGYIVGCSPESRLAAFVQKDENPRFSNFGGFLKGRRGIITSLDYLVPIEASTDLPPPSPPATLRVPRAQAQVRRVDVQHWAGWS